MQSNLYIPKKIKVGFQKRKDTFTGKLGFVTYIDDKGLLRQENAWNGWRDKSVEPVEYDNEPRSSFVFNKDINRSGHWSDITKVRIFDTRDFEFEIDVSNMMYILMHSDISKRDIAEEALEILGLKKEIKHDGYSFNEWVEDFQKRIATIQLKAKKEKLKTLEDRLTSIVSPEQKRQMELEAIMKDLGE